MIESQDIERIKDAASLPAIAGRYVKLRKMGRSWLGLCCFHSEKTPSLRVHDRYFKCFGCGAGGDVISFVRQIEGCSFADAAKIVADHCGIAVDKASAAKVATYKRRRGILDAVLSTRVDILRGLRTDRGIWWSEANAIERMDRDMPPGDPDDPASWALAKDAADRRFIGDMANEWFLEIEAMPDSDYIDLYDGLRTP
jgi:hypothetical protein